MAGRHRAELRRAVQQMTDDEREELRARVELLSLLRELGDGRDQKTWRPMWEVAWKDATAYANGLIAKYNQPNG